MLISPLRRPLPWLPPPSSHRLFKKTGRPLFAEFSTEEMLQVPRDAEPLSFSTLVKAVRNKIGYLNNQLGQKLPLVSDPASPFSDQSPKQTRPLIFSPEPPPPAQVWKA